MKVKKDNAAKRVLDESFFTVDVMDYLVKKGVSNRDAHDILGRMVKDCLDQGKAISSLSLSGVKEIFSGVRRGCKKTFQSPNVC